MSGAGSIDAMERLRAYLDAPIEERCAMIRAHYAAQEAERVARYERRHGPGSVERHRAEALARPWPDRLSVAGPQSRDYWGVPRRGGVWS